MAIELPKLPKLAQELCAEFIGTFILLFVGFAGILLIYIYPVYVKTTHGDCGNATCSFEQENPPEFAGKCNTTGYRCRNMDVYKVEMENIYILMVALAFGSGIAGGLLIAVPVSGGHLNPGVTIVKATLSQIPWSKAALYLLAQYSAGFCSAAAIHFYFLPHTDDDNGVDRRNNFIEYAFVTKPHAKVGFVTVMADAVLSTSIFMMFIMAISDKYANGVPVGAHPFFIFLCFLGILIAFGLNAGVALNPARDLGPKVYAALWVGFGTVFNEWNKWWYWVISQQFGIYIGFLIGGWGYYLLFEQTGPPTTVVVNT